MLVAKLKHATLAVTSPRAIYLCARARRSNMTRQPDAHRMGRAQAMFAKHVARLNSLFDELGTVRFLPMCRPGPGTLTVIWLPASIHGAPDLGSKCRGRNRLLRDDAHLDKLPPNAPHRALRIAEQAGSAGGIALTALCCARRRYALCPRRARGTGIVPAPTSFLKEET